MKQQPVESPTVTVGKARTRLDWAAWALALPLVVFLAFAFFYPLGYTVVQSFLKEHGAGATLLNYSQFLASGKGQGVLLLTVFLSLMATLVSVLLSVPLALALRKRFFGKSFIQFLMLVPALIPALVGALGLLILYDRTGWLNYFLVRVVHVAPHPLVIDYTIPGMILFYVWIYFPYGALVILSGLQSIDPSVEEAGVVLGASPTRVFWSIVFPLLRPSLWAGSILIFLQAFGAFSVPLITGGNHRPLAVMIYTTATVFLEWPRASAMAVIMGLIQAVLVMVFRRLQSGKEATS